MSMNTLQDLREYHLEFTNIRQLLSEAQHLLVRAEQEKEANPGMSNSMYEQAIARINSAAFRSLGLSFTLMDQRTLRMWNEHQMSQKSTDKEE